MFPQYCIGCINTSIYLLSYIIKPAHATHSLLSIHSFLHHSLFTVSSYTACIFPLLWYFLVTLSYIVLFVSHLLNQPINVRLTLDTDWIRSYCCNVYIFPLFRGKKLELQEELFFSVLIHLELFSLCLQGFFFFNWNYKPNKNLLNRCF